MVGDLTNRSAVIAVHVVAVALVAVTPASLYAVLLVYWANALVGAARGVAQHVFAGPREEYAPTEPPAIQRNGDASPLRFLTPKLGTVRPVGWLPPIAVHNCKPAVMGLLAGSAAAVVVGLVWTTLRPPFDLGSWPTAGVAVVAGLAVVVRHGVAFGRFLRSDRPPATRIRTWTWWLGAVGFAGPVVAVDTVSTDAPFSPTAGFTAIAAVIALAGLVNALRRRSTPAGAEPFELTEPAGRPVARFGVDGRAVRRAGLLDGIVPRIEWDVFAVGARLAAAVVASVGGFLAAGLAGASAGVAVAVGVGCLLVVAALFGLAGLVHYELAFGAMEYRLYDEELLAYDTRLGAVQWRVPLAAIDGVSVRRGPWLAPPGTDAAAVTLDRTDDRVTHPPYGFYRRTLAYVSDPEAVTTRLDRALSDR